MRCLYRWGPRARKGWLAASLPRKQDTTTGLYLCHLDCLVRGFVVYNKRIMAMNRISALCWQEMGMCNEGR